LIKNKSLERFATTTVRKYVVVVGLSTEPIQSLSLTLEGVDNVHGCDSLTARMLRVGDGIPNDILEKDLQDTTSLFVDQTGDTLDTPTASETTDRRLGNTLDVIAKDLAMTLGTSLSQSLSSFSSARHDEIC
jgi:hypothetical protein